MTSSLPRVTLSAAVAAVMSVTPGDAAAQAPARWDLAVDVRVGGAPEAPFTRVADLAVGAGGRMYVLEPDARRVRTFAADGRPAPSVGRTLRGTARLGWRGDSLWVAEPEARRISLFDARGRPAGTVGPARAGAPAPWALLADGSVLGAVSAKHAGAARAPLPRLRRDGTMLGVVDSLSVARRTLRVRDPAAAPDAPALERDQPFGDASLLAVAHDGKAAVVVDRSADAAPGSRGTFTVRRYDARGRLVWRSRVPYTARPLEDAVVAAATEPIAREAAARHDLGAPSAAAAAAWVRAAMHRPRTLPPVTAVVAARDGRTWLRREDAGSAAVAWQVLDARGHVAGSLVAPASFRLMEADAGHAWGVMQDARGTSFVLRFRVVPAPRPPAG
jgi:hypothetical protein